jgi:8-amino-7-oxononanoate synthase
MLIGDWLSSGLAALEGAGLLRDPVDAGARELMQRDFGGGLLDAASNDYLGLGARLVSRETLETLQGARIGAGASRLVQGSSREHEILENELADWTGYESALVTTSAYAANAGLLPALAGEGALVISDAYNHASIVDGCRLARARVAVTPHLDLDATEKALRARPSAAPTWVVTEALFSMDGDRPDLRALRGLCDRYGAALMVDEAHSLGVDGPQGAGALAAAGVPGDVLVAGLGKAVGGQGGFIAASTQVRTWLWNRARSFVFSTAPSPILTALMLEQVKETRRADEPRKRLQARSTELRHELQARGLPVIPGSSGPIVPVLLGSNERALAAMRRLRAAGILAQAIRPPTVPQGSARLRLTVHSDWPNDAAVRIASAVEHACES